MCVCVWLKNKYVSILSQGLTFQNMPKSQWGEGHSETGVENKEKRATCHLNVGIKSILSSHFLKLMVEADAVV